MPAFLVRCSFLLSCSPTVGLFWRWACLASWGRLLTALHWSFCWGLCCAMLHMQWFHVTHGQPLQETDGSLKKCKELTSDKCNGYYASQRNLLIVASELSQTVAAAELQLLFWKRWSAPRPCSQGRWSRLCEQWNWCLCCDSGSFKPTFWHWTFCLFH